MKISIIKSSNIDDYKFRNLYARIGIQFSLLQKLIYYLGEKGLALFYYRNKKAVPVKIKTYELSEVLGSFIINSKSDIIIDNTGNALTEFNYLGQIKRSKIIINSGFKYLGQIHERIYNSGRYL